MANGQMQTQMTPAQLQQANLQARGLIVSNGVQMMQQIFSTTAQPATQSIYNIPPQNVGLITGFFVKMSALITNPSSGSTTLTRTAFGPANLLQNIQFTDLQNYTRINTPGWHLNLINSAKQGMPFLSALTTDSPIGYGDNMLIVDAPSTISTNSTGTVYMYYWIPMSYTDVDLTGAIYANLVNSTMNLQLTLATAAQAVVASTADPTTAMYQGSGAVAGVTLTNVAFTIYQCYYDQLPQGPQGPILPVVDLNTIYELKQTSFTGISASQDFNMPYTNFRNFLSTCMIYDNVTGGAYPTFGTDLNYLQIITANLVPLKKADPYTWGALARKRFKDDPPVGVYYFDHREKPINTTQFGNMNLSINASTVNSSAKTLVGYEMFSNVNNVINAGSLASN